jgi:steroid delta-isomerase
MDENHPALVAARSSWRCVQAKDKEAWLALMADDVLFEDPIGAGPTNPTGEGIRGKAALSDFFDKNMAPNTIRIETHESFVAGNESAHVMTLTTSFPNAMRMIVHGIFTYAVDESGLLTNLRGYWTVADSKFEKIESSA